MQQSLFQIALLVKDYDEAIDFYTQKLSFVLIEDTEIPEQNKRWVVIAPPGSSQTQILLARASSPEQVARIGDQTGGRVFLFLSTDDLERDYQQLLANGVTIVREPQQQPYGKVLVFADLYGNQWDLIERQLEAVEALPIEAC